MRNTLFCLLMVGYISTFAQNGTTFKVENLSKPEKLLFIKSYEDIYKGLILSDLKIYPYEIKEKNINARFLSQYYHKENKDCHHFMIVNYSGIQKEKLEKAIEILGEII